MAAKRFTATFPDLPDFFSISNEADIIAKANPNVTEWLNAIGADSQFYETYGYYADPVDENAAKLPHGWRERLIPLPPGKTRGATGLCLDPHDLAISKYFARTEKDVRFTTGMVERGIVKRTRCSRCLK